MRARQTLLPTPWLLTDNRTGASLFADLAALPRGAGVILRHYHLPPLQRRALFVRVKRLCRARGLVLVLAGSARLARAWGAHGCYGPAPQIAAGPATLRLMTAHSLHELGAGPRTRADAALLSPVFATRSHPGAVALGPVRFLLLAQHASVPVIALGGMSASRARRLSGHGWAAIDGLSRKTQRNPKDS